MPITNYLLKLLILLIPFYFVRFSLGPIPTTLLEVAIYLVFLYFVFTRKLKLTDKMNLVIPAVAFTLLALIGAISDPNLIRGLGLWKGYFFDGLLVFLLFISSKDKEVFGKIVLYSAAIAAVLSLALYFSGVKTIDGRLLDYDRLSPNYLAMFLTPTLVLGTYYLAKSRGFLEIASVLLIALALYLTDSRGALVGLAGVIIFSIYLFAKKSYKNWSTAILILGLVGFFIGGYLVYKPDFTDHSRKATSSNVRYYIWSTSLQIASEKPVFGLGLGNFQDYFTEKTKTWVNYPEFISPQALTAHNLYLHLFLSGGLFTLASFVYLLVKSRFYNFSNTGYSLALLAILFYGLVDTPIFRNDLAIQFWLLLALASNHFKSANSSK